MNNPRYALLLANYLKYDTMTLILAGTALLAVLLGWSMTTLKHNSRLDEILKKLFLGFILIGFLVVLAGTCFILFRGGYS